eukprot:14205120-Alexandrium_andersonii.AAC.1
MAVRYGRAQPVSMADPRPQGKRGGGQEAGRPPRSKVAAAARAAQSQRSSFPQGSPEGPLPTQRRAPGEKVAWATTGRNPLVKAGASLEPGGG